MRAHRSLSIALAVLASAAWAEAGTGCILFVSANQACDGGCPTQGYLCSDQGICVPSGATSSATAGSSSASVAGSSGTIGTSGTIASASSSSSSGASTASGAQSGSSMASGSTARSSSSASASSSSGSSGTTGQMKLGQACSASSDCIGGLDCFGSVCSCGTTHPLATGTPAWTSASGTDAWPDLGQSSNATTATFLNCLSSGGCSTSADFSSVMVPAAAKQIKSLVGISVIPFGPKAASDDPGVAMAYTDGANLYFAECSSGCSMATNWSSTLLYGLQTTAAASVPQLAEFPSGAVALAVAGLAGQGYSGTSYLECTPGAGNVCSSGPNAWYGPTQISSSSPTGRAGFGISSHASTDAGNVRNVVVGTNYYFCTSTDCGTNKTGTAWTAGPQLSSATATVADEEIQVDAQGLPHVAALVSYSVLGFTTNAVEYVRCVSSQAPCTQWGPLVQAAGDWSGESSDKLSLAIDAQGLAHIAYDAHPLLGGSHDLTIVSELVDGGFETSPQRVYGCTNGMPIQGDLPSLILTDAGSPRVFFNSLDPNATGAAWLSDGP